MKWHHLLQATHDAPFSPNSHSQSQLLPSQFKTIKRQHIKYMYLMKLLEQSLLPQNLVKKKTQKQQQQKTHTQTLTE